MTRDAEVAKVEVVSHTIPPEPQTPKEVALEAVMLLPNVLKLFGKLMKDRRVAVRDKAMVGAVIAYLVSPVDFVPDFVIGLGKLDDIILAAIALNHLLKGSSSTIVREHWDGTEESLELVLSAVEFGATVVPSSIKRFLSR